MTGPSQPLLLVDTNVWVNNYIDRGPSHDSAKQFVVSALQHDAVLCTSAGTLKDVYFAISAELKKLQRASGGAVDASFAAAIDEVAWSCIVNLMDISTIVPIGSGDALMATTFRSAHRDFEDDILLAIARRICAACIVTDDCGLLAHFPQLCISPQHALELLEE